MFQITKVQPDRREYFELTATELNEIVGLHVYNQPIKPGYKYYDFYYEDDGPGPNLFSIPVNDNKLTEEEGLEVAEFVAQGREVTEPQYPLWDKSDMITRWDTQYLAPAILLKYLAILSIIPFGEYICYEC